MRRDIELDPHDRVLAAVVRQAIADLRTGPKAEREASREYLAQMGLLDDAGVVVRAAVADVSLVWPETVGSDEPTTERV